MNRTNRATSEELTKLLVDKLVKELKEGQDLFLTGSGGVGKSYITRLIVKEFKSPTILGSTNQSALNINGATLHKVFKLETCKNIKQLKAYDRDKIKKLQARYNRSEEIVKEWHFRPIKEVLNKTDLILIDEISMISKDTFDLFIYRLKSLADKKIPILVVGDFYQLPPVNSDLAFLSKYWKFKTYELAVIKRTNEVKFSKAQIAIREGKKSKLVKSLIDVLSSRKTAPSGDALRLYPLNKQVKAYNAKKLKELEEKSNNIVYTFKTELVFKEDYIPNFRVDSFINSLQVKDSIKLVVGARILFIATYDGLYYNGERGTILDINTVTGVIRVKKDNGSIVEVERFIFSDKTYTVVDGKLTLKKEIEVSQYPMILAYAVTIHKTQGMTIDSQIVIDCKNLFAEGQFYVAISRATRLKNIYLKDVDINKHIRPNIKVKQFYNKLKKNNQLIRLENY